MPEHAIHLEYCLLAGITALFEEGLQGGFRVHAENDKLKIERK